MTARPWFPFYTADYDRDTFDLSVEQHGVYFLLLKVAYSRQDGDFPNDKNWLRSIFPGMHGRTFNHLVPPILDRFFLLENGRWHHKRVRKEIEKASKLSRKQSENASKRWVERKENKDLQNATAMPSQSQSQSHTKKDSGAKAPADVRTRLFRDGAQLLADQTGRTPDSCKSLIGRWLKLTDDEAVHVLAAIEDAHRNRVADPTAWITATLKGGKYGQAGKPRSKPGIKATFDDIFERIEREADPRVIPFQANPRLLSNG